MNTKKQEGAALIVGLILMVIITLIGYSSMKGTMLQEKMAAGIHNRILANGGANSSLRDGEDYLYNLIANTNAENIQGSEDGSLYNIYSVYNEPLVPASGLNSVVESFKQNDWTTGAGTEHSENFTATGYVNADLSVNPQYIIQLVDQITLDGPSGEVPNVDAEAGQQKIFLVTAKSRSGDGNSFSLVQSLYTAIVDSET